MEIVLAFVLVTLLGMAALLGFGLKLAIGRKPTPPEHADLFREARARRATGRPLERSPESLWTARRLLVRTEGRESIVFDGSGRLLGRADDEALLDAEGRPQLLIRHHVPKNTGGIPRDVLHPDGSSFGRLALDRQVYRSLKLHLFDPAGNRVAGFRTLDRNGHSVVVEDNGGRPLATVRRAHEELRRAEDGVELVAPLGGGFHALVLMAALRAFAWQRSEWQVAPHSSYL